jgi:hypothetical protein
VGSGYTVEGQKTGEEKFGGLQLEIIRSYERILRTWLPEPTGRGAARTTFDWPRVLDEQKIPSELGLNPGNKIRCFPSNPIYFAPIMIADLVRNSSKEDTHIQVRKVCHKERCVANFIQALYQYHWSQITKQGMSDGGWLGSRTSSRARLFPVQTEVPRILYGSSFAAAVGQSCSVPRSTPEMMFSDFTRTSSAPLVAEQHSSAQAPTTDLKAMGLAAGGKLGLFKFSVLDRSSRRHHAETSERLTLLQFRTYTEIKSLHASGT